MRNFNFSLFSYSARGSIVKYNLDTSGWADLTADVMRVITDPNELVKRALENGVMTNEEGMEILSRFFRQKAEIKDTTKKELAKFLDEWDNGRGWKSIRDQIGDAGKAVEKSDTSPQKAGTEGKQKTSSGESLSDETFKNLFPKAPFSPDELKYVLGDQDIKRAVGRALNGESFDATSKDLGNLFSDTDKELAKKMHDYLKGHPESQAAFLSYIGKDTNIIPFFGTDDAERNTASIKQLGEKAKNANPDNKGTVRYVKNTEGGGKLHIDKEKNTQLNAIIGNEDEREGLWGDVVNPTVLAAVIADRGLQKVYRNITWNKNDTIQFNDTKDILEARKDIHDALVIFSKISADSAGGSGLAALADGKFDDFFKKVHKENPNIKVDLRDMQMSDTVKNLAMMLGGIGIAVATEWALLANGEVQTVSSDDYAKKQMDKAKNTNDTETDGTFLDWANTKVLKPVKGFILGRKLSWRPGEESWTKDFEANTDKMAQDITKLTQNKNGSFDTSKIPEPNQAYIKDILWKTKAFENLTLERVQKLVLSTYIQQQARINQGHDVFASIGFTGIGTHLDTLGVDGEAIVENKQAAGIESEFTKEPFSMAELREFGIIKDGNNYNLPTEMLYPFRGMDDKLPVYYNWHMLTAPLSVSGKPGEVPAIQIHKNEDAPYIEVKMVPGVRSNKTTAPIENIAQASDKQAEIQSKINTDISKLPKNWTRTDKKRTRQDIISAFQGGNAQGAFDALGQSSVKAIRNLHDKYGNADDRTKALVAESVVNSGVVHVNAKKGSTIDSVMAKENKNTRYENFENKWLEHSGLTNAAQIKEKWLAQNKGKEYSSSGQQANGFGFMMNGSMVDGVYGRSSLSPTAHVIGDLLPLDEKDYNQYDLAGSILRENRDRLTDIRDEVNKVPGNNFTQEELQSKLLGMDVAGLEELKTSFFFGRFKECANGAVIMRVSFAGKEVEYTSSVSDSATFKAGTAEIFRSDLVATPAPLVRELTEGGGQGESVPPIPTGSVQSVTDTTVAGGTPWSSVTNVVDAVGAWF